MFSVLLSMWGPLATGVAVAQSRSATQTADFLRRSLELVALLVSWWVFRRLGRGAVDGHQQARLERWAAGGVVLALASSGLVMLVLGLLRFSSTAPPSGRVHLGFSIAFLGLVVNGWFWRRYTGLNRDEPDTIMLAQSQLYRAKALVDLGVVLALGSLLLWPGHPVTRYVDAVGAVMVAAYLLWTSWCSSQRLRAGDPSRLVTPD